MAKRSGLASLLILSASIATLAGEPIRLPETGPIPAPRPHAAVDFNGVTGSIPVSASDAIAGAPVSHFGDVTALTTGLNALTTGDAHSAQAIRDRLSAHSLDRHILSWAIALSGADGVTSREIAATARTLPGWPGMSILRANSERALAREDPSTQAVLSAFGKTQPQTYEGVTMLARADVATGDTDAARKVISPFWRTEKLEAGQEAAIIREFGGIIAEADHRYRMERMLYEDRVESAMRVAGLAGAVPLAKAWGAVIRNRADAGPLLDAVPAGQHSAGYDFARARYLRRAGKFEAAEKVVLAAPRDAGSLIDPDEWWVERRVLSRELLDIGDAGTAYHVAASHSAGSAGAIADAEFHAGWYALQGLHDPKRAAPHFARIADIADGPISLARAYYWLGRAAEAGGPGDATGFYRDAARYDTAFYGQIAAEKLGRHTLTAAYPETTAADRDHFSSREAVHAIERLEEAGYGWRADILYRELAGELTSTGELALLANMAERSGDRHLALRIGKIAASRGIDIGVLAHPVGAIPASAEITGSHEALAYAVARQESEFNVGAVSRAGALGLLQLMPGTAKRMAQETGLAYSSTRLTTDAAYNARLGSAYLGDQLDRFGGSYILTFAGYNAGPNRVAEWVARYGDPRGKDVDTVVDWIERIPYTETRNYVERVMENFQVYKMRLDGHFDIAGDLKAGGDTPPASKEVHSE